jgi:hypothetical protein
MAEAEPTEVLERERPDDDLYEPPETEALPGSGSILDELRERREAIASDTETVLPVEVFEGKLAVHYRLLEWKRTQEFAERVQKARGRDPLADLQASASLIAEATLGVLIPNPDEQGTPPEGAPVTWGWKSIDPSGEPVLFEQRLLELFRITNDGPKLKRRDIVRLVFNRDHAVTAHAQDVLIWMQSANGQVNRDFAEG